MNPLDLNFVFKSYDHLRYENGQHVSGPHGGANRAITVEPNRKNEKSFTVTFYNLDGPHPVWRNNVQMAPKQMEIIQQTIDKIVLRGYGYDAMGGSFADYGITIHLKNSTIEKCVLHMHDRNVDIEYLKSNVESIEKKTSNERGVYKEIEEWVKDYFLLLPMEKKMDICSSTDDINNNANLYYNNNDFENAIKYYNMALEVMPINNDALQNLISCYEAINNFNKIREVKEKLDYVMKLRRESGIL